MAADFQTLEATIAAFALEKERGDAFERAVAHLLRRDPELGVRRVWGWRDWPGRAAVGAAVRDLGIDLVAEDSLGRLIGVQVKFRRDPDRLIRWEDIATAVGYRPGLFSRRLIVTNAWDRGPNAREALGAPEPLAEPIGWVLRDTFLASPIDWSDALALGLSGEAGPERHPRPPRPHQVAAVADVVAALVDQPRAQLVMACGSGKTLTTLWVAEARGAERVLVLVPSLLLLRQFRRDWIESASFPFVDLVVCSDETTVGMDEVRVRADDLGVPVTTDPAEIGTFLVGLGRRVVFATYQSSERIAEAQEDPSIPAFDLVIADEAHKLAGVHATADRRVRDLKVVLDAERIRARRRLFATATPRIYGAATRRRLREDPADIELASMDDETVFGPVAHRLSFRAAVDAGILVDYELVVVVVTDAEVGDLIDRRAIIQADELTTDAESLAFLVAVRKAITELGLRRSISFHSSIARARTFARWLPLVIEAPPVPQASHVSGAMPTGERNRIVARLRNPQVPTLITNARCLTEGIDVPALDAVLFVDPRGSHVDIVQAVGRAMRTASGKTLGRVILPVFLSEAEAADPTGALESTAFRPVLDVLRALRAHDDELADEATRVRIELGRRGTRLVDSGFIRDHIRVVDGAAALDVAALDAALELKAVEISARGFDVWLAAVQSFAAREGHARVHLEHIEDGLKLGQFVAINRYYRRRGTLDPERQVALESFPGWTWEPVEDDWQEGIDTLQRFVAREGHSRVPSGHFEDGLPLGAWIGSRRAAFRRAELPPDRVTMLESLPGWSWRPREDDWQSGLAVLGRYVTRTGNARVPNGHAEEDFPLGRWVMKRRSYHNAGSLSSERVETLEALPGWTWAARETAWSRGYAQLEAYLAHQGHARVDYDYVQNGFRLGQWVAGQRSYHRRGTLPAERVAALEQLPGWVWEAYGSDWERGLENLRSYAAREGHADVPQAHVEQDFRLGSWVSARRADDRAGRLSPDRRAALESVPGWTWRHVNDTWQVGLDRLHGYVRREGHARVPALHDEAGFHLGQWVQRQRLLFRNGRLPDQRTSALVSMPGWSWGTTGTARKLPDP